MHTRRLKRFSQYLFCFMICSQMAIGQPLNKNDFPFKAPAGFSILDTASFDFNNDGLRDYIVILNNNNEINNPDTTRPLLILKGSKDNQLSIFARNDNVVLCMNCGGVFGDPYQGITTKGAFFSIDHYGGSGWRWTRNITFRYKKNLQVFFLHKDGGISYHASDPDKTEDFFYHKEWYGKMPFKEYNNRDSDQ